MLNLRSLLILRIAAGLQALVLDNLSCPVLEEPWECYD